VNGTYGWTRANCDGFATVARWIAADLQPFTDVSLRTIPNGVDTSRFLPGPPPTRERGPIVAWVGRAGSLHKRLDLFAAVAPLLRSTGIRVWVVDQHGPEHVTGLYGQAIADLLARNCDRWDAVAFEQMPDLYRTVAASGGCIVSTSQSEGMPLTLLEAQACGCPVIASDVRGNNECVSPALGGTLYPLDLPAEQLAKLITARLADTASLTQSAAAAATHVTEHFSLTRTTERYLDLYRNGPPQPARLPLTARLRGRTRLSALRSWRGYMDYRWGTAHRQWETARQLAAAGAGHLAAATARTSFATAPTLYLSPRRLSFLLRTMRPRAAKSLSMTPALRRWLEVSPRFKVPRTCGDEELLKGRGPSQMEWYAYAAELCAGRTVLDVGCGSGEGLKLLTATASTALGIDLDTRLRRPDVRVEIKSIEDMPDKSFDVVVCMDVIEHVMDDRAFLDHLIRVARETVFVTTPNYTISRNRNPFHVREYTPKEFEALFIGRGRLTLLGGSARGAERVEISRRAAYFLVNDLYAWKPTLLAAKVLKRLLHVKVWKHQAAVLQLQPAGTGASVAAA
jgi:2-polyprenyl-3-methyl-5-hydroxy-6-metoxy-1,4-benzoquinol methylase